MCAQITLQSIANRLGCSAKTVSNAFNRPDQLSAATRERVLALAAELGYPGPNPLAAGLRRGRAASGPERAQHLRCCRQHLGDAEDVDELHEAQDRDDGGEGARRGGVGGRLFG